MTDPVVVPTRPAPAATIGGVFGMGLSLAVRTLSAANNIAISVDNVSYTAVLMSEGFVKLSAIEQDLKLRQATHELQIKTAAMSQLLGVALEAPIAPPVKPALQM